MSAGGACRGAPAAAGGLPRAHQSRAGGDPARARARGIRIDRTGVNPDDFRSQYRYVVVFKLNQDPTARLNDADFRRGINGPRGNYSIAGFNLSSPEGDPDSFRDVPNCFFSFVAGPWRPLDRVKLGRRVETRLRPLTPSPDGEATLGRLYVVRSTLRLADPRLSRPAARAALHRIGCLRR